MAGNNYKVADFYPQRLSQYVPAMTYHSDIGPNGIYIASLGTPAVADTDGMLDGVDTTAVTGSITVTGNALLGAIGATADSPYGRNVTVTGAGAGSKVLTIYGYDYLGQYMAEVITCTTGAGAGLKAFKRVTSIGLGAVAGDSDSDFGWGDVLGLPFATKAILSEFADEAVQSAGTFVDVLRTDPQTTAIGDSRGTYNPTVTLDGSVEVVIVGIADNYVNSSGNGGLHGIAYVSS